MSMMHWKRLSMIAALSAAGVFAAGVEAKLADAAQQQDAATVRTLLKQHVDVNFQQVDGTSALIWAAHNDDLATADLLIKAGADAKVTNRYGISALAEAAQNGSAPMIALLLKAGADPNTTLAEGDNVLMLASRAGNAAAVKVLLDSKARVDAKENWHGETALMWAAGENHADIVKLLIANGANPNAQAPKLERPEMKKGPAQVFSSYPAGGLTALIHAARENSFEAAQALLAAGANPNQRDPNNIGPLMVAVTNAHWDMANLLLEKGADPNDGSLVQAIEMRNSNVLRPASNHEEKFKDLDLIQSLIAHGAKPESIMIAKFPAQKALGGGPGGPADQTPLFRAAKAADLIVMRLLIEKGADPKFKLRDESTALMAAAGLGAPLATGIGPLQGPTNDKRIEATKYMLSLGTDINQADSSGMTPLHAAARVGADSIIQFLADSGAKLDLKDKRGRTALDIANGVVGARLPNEMPMGPNRNPEVYPSTVALLRKLMGLPPEPAKTSQLTGDQGKAGAQ
jgi:uncharacterized protein